MHQIKTPSFKLLLLKKTPVFRFFEIIFISNTYLPQMGAFIWYNIIRKLTAEWSSVFSFSCYNKEINSNFIHDMVHKKVYIILCHEKGIFLFFAFAWYVEMTKMYLTPGSWILSQIDASLNFQKFNKSLWHLFETLWQWLSPVTKEQPTKTDNVAILLFRSKNILEVFNF